MVEILNVCSKDWTFYSTDACSTVFIPAPFTIGRKLKQNKCPSKNEWIMKMWHVNTMKFYSVEKKNEIIKISRK